LCFFFFLVCKKVYFAAKKFMQLKNHTALV
jgi:hypothetical protein